MPRYFELFAGLIFKEQVPHTKILLINNYMLPQGVC